MPRPPPRKPPCSKIDSRPSALRKIHSDRPCPIRGPGRLALFDRLVCAAGGIFPARRSRCARCGARPIDVTAFGARMRLYPQRNVAEKRLAFTPQYFDAPERNLLASKLSGDFVFLDIGASVGGYALFAAGLGCPGARILAVEPLPEVFERLVYNIRQSDFPNIKAVGCAVVDIDGEVTLFVNTSNQGETSTRIVSAEAIVEQIRVPAKTLLTLVREEGYDRLDAIKLDIEGAEDLALEPYLREAPRALWPRLIIMEFTLLVSAQELEAHLRDLGYHEILRTSENVAYEINPES